MEFPYNTKGMNSKGGLIRGHWAARKKEKEKIMWDILGQVHGKHQGQVKITYLRRSPRLMDWDNLSSTFKFFGDMLVKTSVIKDDSPKIIPSSPEFKQEKGKAWTQIIIEDIE